MGLERLLEEIPEAYYWAGFLMADGYFRIDALGYDCQLQLGMSEKDRCQIELFANFIDAKVGTKDVKLKSKIYRQAVCSKRDSKALPKIIKKFSINKDKTHNPPARMMIKKNDLFLSFLVGFIDGDGCIRKDNGCIIVACEKAWKETLDSWFLRLWQISKAKSAYNLKIPVCKVDKNMCRIQTNHDGIKAFIISKIKELKIPVLKRKWNNIADRDLTLDSNKMADRNSEIFEYVKSGRDVKWIAKKVNMKYGNCWRIVNEFKTTSSSKTLN